jgi:hypothetical protein
VERGWTPLPCALDIAHGFRLPSRAPGIAASNGTAVGKGEGGGGEGGGGSLFLSLVPVRCFGAPLIVFA